MCVKGCKYDSLTVPEPDATYLCVSVPEVIGIASVILTIQGSHAWC